MTKKRYIVRRYERWIQGVWINAESKEEAIRLVAEGEGEDDQDLFEYSDTLDPDNWTADEVNPL